MEEREQFPGGPPDSTGNEELRQGVHDLGELFGLSGLEVEIKPGAGWKCTKLPDGIKITVDPDQLIERRGPDGKDTSGDTDTPQTDERYALHTSGHELGHGKDFIDPNWTKPSNDPSEHFFWNVVDDAVIDKRLRRVPALDDITDQLYSQVLFPTDNLTAQPKHVQLMHAILLNTVTENPMPEIDPSVAEALDELTQFESQGEVFNILETMADPRTTLKERRAIARKFIMPLYKELLEQDKEEQQQADGQEDGEGGEGQGESGEGGGSFEEHYGEYEQTMHGGDHSHMDDQSDQKDKGEGEGGESKGEDSGSGGEGSESMDHAEQIAAVLKENAKEADLAGQVLNALAQATDQGQAEASHAQTMANLAGNVAGKMNLSQGDAKEYVNSLDRWAQTIRETAQVFLQLAAPTTSTMSPRYEGRSMPEGVRLHPSRLAETALQLDSEQEQAVWQPVERRAKRQNVAFGGLDIHLLVDVSGSMANSGKAACAAACSQILLEGIQLARFETAQAGPQQTQPDVRTQVIGFGEGTEVLAPLSYAPTEPQKGAVFSNLMHPDSGSTLVSGALAKVHNSVKGSPGRETIVIIVSDGKFGDHKDAKTHVDGMPENVHVAHLVIGGGTNKYVSPNHQDVRDPSKLPTTLFDVLADRIREMQG